MIGEGLQASLRRTYRADRVTDGLSADEALRSQDFDLVLLDLGLPGMDGLQVLQNLRARGDTTMVLVMTARDAVSDRVAGLDAGADDYLVKPFELDELDARIRALDRRRGDRAEPFLEHGPLAIDPARREVAFQGKPVTLTNREFTLLLAFAQKPGAVFAVSELEDHVYGWNEEVESNAIEFLVHQLRRKLSKTAILNVRGQGYKLAVP